MPVLLVVLRVGSHVVSRVGSLLGLVSVMWVGRELVGGWVVRVAIFRIPILWTVVGRL